MTRIGELVLASGNVGKQREFARLLAPLGVRLLSQGELGVEPCDEPYSTFVGNALRKAFHASRLTGLPALADDSGICVDALAGAPGVYSARYSEMAGGAAGDEANNRLLVSSLAGQTNRSAYYYCVLVLVRSATDPQPLIADGHWHGQVLDDPRGSGGFGYDPHFLLPGLNRTAAELSAHDKNAVSHRGQAMRALCLKLVEFGLVQGGPAQGGLAQGGVVDSVVSDLKP